MGLGDFFGGGSNESKSSQHTTQNETSDITGSSNTVSQGSQTGSQRGRSGLDFGDPNAQLSLSYLTQGLQGGNTGLDSANRYFGDMLRQDAGTVNPYVQKTIDANRAGMETDLRNRIAQATSALGSQGNAVNQNVMGQIIANALNQRTSADNQLLTGQYNQDVQNQMGGAGALAQLGSNQQNVAMNLLPLLAERFQNVDTEGQQQATSDTDTQQHIERLIDSLTTGTSTTANKASGLGVLQGIAGIGQSALGFL